MSRIDNTKYAQNLLKQDASNTYSFDLTTISSDSETQPFEALVERHGLTEHEAFEYLPQYSTSERTAFIWYNPENGLVIECNKNPVGEETPGNASYIAICGPTDAAKSLAVDLVLTAEFVKDGGPDAGFASIDSAVKEHVQERIRETLDEREEQRTAHLTGGEA